MHATRSSSQTLDMLWVYRLRPRHESLASPHQNFRIIRKATAEDGVWGGADDEEDET